MWSWCYVSKTNHNWSSPTIAEVRVARKKVDLDPVAFSSYTKIRLSKCDDIIAKKKSDHFLVVKLSDKNKRGQTIYAWRGLVPEKRRIYISNRCLFY